MISLFIREPFLSVLHQINGRRHAASRRASLRLATSISFDLFPESRVMNKGSFARRSPLKSFCKIIARWRLAVSQCFSILPLMIVGRPMETES